jgi:hypothetical protein
MDMTTPVKDSEAGDTKDAAPLRIPGVVLSGVIDVAAIAKMQVYVEAEHLSVAAAHNGVPVICGAVATRVSNTQSSKPLVGPDMCRLYRVMAPPTTKGCDDLKHSVPVAIVEGFWHTDGQVRDSDEFAFYDFVLDKFQRQGFIFCMICGRQACEEGTVWTMTKDNWSLPGPAEKHFFKKLLATVSRKTDRLQWFLKQLKSVATDENCRYIQMDFADIFYNCNAASCKKKDRRLFPVMSSVRRCTNCGQVERCKTCARCRSIWYCSSKCQAAHWSVHRAVCVRATL